MIANKETSGVYARGVEEIALSMRREFLDEVLENLRGLNLGFAAVRQGKKPLAEAIEEARRFSLPLRGQAGNFGVHLIGAVALRMEDFLANVKDTPPSIIGGLQVFVDTIEDIAEGRTPFDADAAAIVRKLPAKVKFGPDDITIEVRNVEVLLVMLHGAATRFVEREMQQCGYRVSTVTTVFEALPLIVRTKPDLVIISAIMPELDGIDLAIALAAMPSTRNIPTALITSLNADDDHLKLLPDSIPVIHKGDSFGDDLANTLSRLFLI